MLRNESNLLVFRGKFVLSASRLGEVWVGIESVLGILG